MSVVIARTTVDEYQLRIDDEVVETYETGTLAHPDDWFDDAASYGAEGWEMASGRWEFVDETIEDTE